MLIAVTDKGIRLGQDHQNAKLTDREVQLIRDLHEQGLSYTKLADKFDVAKSTIASIVKFQRRAQVPLRWREI